MALTRHARSGKSYILTTILLGYYVIQILISFHHTVDDIACTD